MANSAFSCTALTGGTDGSLDNIDGAILSDGDIGYVVNAADETVSVYTLDASSGDAESSPDIISPDTNAGTKRWILTKLIGQGLDLDGNVLTLDADGDTSIEASTDDYIVIKLNGSDLVDIDTASIKINGLSLWTDIDDDTGITSAAGDDKLDIYVNGAKDFEITPNTFKASSGSLIASEVFKCLEKSADPTQPSEGEAVIWMSDGTGKGDDGDVLIASTAGGVTTYATLFDHSAGSAW